MRSPLGIPPILTSMLVTAQIALSLVFLACGSEATTPSVDPTEKQTAPPVTQPQTQAPSTPQASLQASSKVVYTGSPEDPHKLQITLAEGGYARLRLASDPHVQGRRVLQHSTGQGIFVTPARASESMKLEGPAEREARAGFDLRWALYTWREQDAWLPDPANAGTKSLRLKNRGTITATFDEGKNVPSSMQLFDLDGVLVRALTHIEWPAANPEGDPVSFQVESSSGLLWKESNISVRRGLQMKPTFFTPADRRK